MSNSVRNLAPQAKVRLKLVNDRKSRKSSKKTIDVLSQTTSAKIENVLEKPKETILADTVPIDLKASLDPEERNIEDEKTDNVTISQRELLEEEDQPNY